jgi:hypothetical protein
MGTDSPPFVSLARDAWISLSVMKRSLVPAALFLTLVVSVVVSLPLKGTVVMVSVIGFMGSLAGLAWWVLWADRRPVAVATSAPGDNPDSPPPYDDDWQSFERAFWAHVAEHETASGLDPYDA